MRADFLNVNRPSRQQNPKHTCDEISPPHCGRARPWTGVRSKGCRFGSKQTYAVQHGMAALLPTLWPNTLSSLIHFLNNTREQRWRHRFGAGGVRKRFIGRLRQQIIETDTILFELACQPILAFYEEAITARYARP